MFQTENRKIQRFWYEDQLDVGYTVIIKYDENYLYGPYLDFIDQEIVIDGSHELDVKLADASPFEIEFYNLKQLLEVE